MAILRPPHEPFTAARLIVIAGVNGGGKSSIAGAAIREFGGEYFNPDEAARVVLQANPNLTQEGANSAAWREGVRLLKRAMVEQLDYAFETTLGGNTIPRLLSQAASQGSQIHLWYVGLSSVPLHIERVRARVRRGGHHIPEEDIRRRFDRSRLNLIELLPHLTALRVFDNSTSGDPSLGQLPNLQLVLHMEEGKILGPKNLQNTPTWAKPILSAAMKLHEQL